MAAEVADEAVVVHAEVSDAIVHFGAGVDDARVVVGEASERIAVFLALQFFGMRAGFGVEELDCIVCACENNEFAAVIKVDGGVVSARWCFEEARCAIGADYIGDLAHSRCY